MRTCLVIAVLLLAVSLGLAADTAGLSPEMWQRVRASESAAVDLTPTASPQAPATLSLQDCIGLAFKHNAGFRQQQENLVSARRSFYVADQRLFYTIESDAKRARPVGGTADTAQSATATTRWEQLRGGTVGLTVGTGTQEVFSDLLSQRPAVSLAYDLPLLRGFGLASSTYERLRGARTGLQSQGLSLYDARQALAVEIIQDYFNVLLAEQEITIAQSAMKRAEERYDLNYALFTGEDRKNPEASLKKPGETWVSQVNELDMDQARFSWEQAKQSLNRQQQAYRDAADQLLLDMGFLPGATPKLTTQIAYTPQEYDEKALAATALANSTGLAQLDLSREDAEAARRIAYSQGKPDLTASVGVTDAGQTLGEQVSAGWFGGLRVAVPLWERSRRENKDRAERVLQVLDQRIIAERDSVAQDVQRLVRAANASKERIAIGEETVRLARKNYDQAKGMYEEGLSDYLRVLDADARLVSAERSLLGEQVQYFLTTVRVRRAVGEDVTQGLPS